MWTRLIFFHKKTWKIHFLIWNLWWKVVTKQLLELALEPQWEPEPKQSFGSTTLVFRTIFPCARGINTRWRFFPLLFFFFRSPRFLHACERKAKKERRKMDAKEKKREFSVPAASRQSWPGSSVLAFLAVLFWQSCPGSLPSYLPLCWLSRSGWSVVAILFWLYLISVLHWLSYLSSPVLAVLFCLFYSPVPLCLYFSSCPVLAVLS